MLFKAAPFFILIFSKTFQGTPINNNLIPTITNFVNNLKTTVKITTYVCWSNEDKKLLWKNLTSSYYLNLLTNNKINYGLPQHQLFIIDLRCKTSLSVLQQAREKKLFKSPFRWLIYGNITSLSDFYFGVDSQIYVIKSDSYEIVTAYKYSSESTLIQKNYVTNSNNKFPVSERTNLMGARIKISYVITNKDSLNHLWDYRDRHIDAISKLNYILVNYLMDFLNASREFIVQETWGYKNATTGLYSGMAGDLQKGLADLGGTPLFFTVDRIDIIDYIAATTPTYMKFIFRAPPLSYVTNVFTLPFDSSVWHYCFVMFAVVFVCIYFIAKWEWHDPKFRQKSLNNQQFDMLKPGIFDAVMFEISAVTQQGYNEEPKSNAGRIITIFTFITLMFLYTSYSANIVALLQSTTNSIRTLEDLLNSRIKLGVDDIVYAHYYFENAQEPIRKAIYQQKIAPKGQKPNFMKPEEGIRRVQQGFFAFHVELHAGYKVIGDIFQEGEKCGLKEIEYVNLIEPWLAIQKKSVYSEVIKIGMRKLHENGIQNREKRRIYTRKPQCLSGGSNFGSVGLVDCYSAFLLFGIGNIAAILLLLLESIIKKYSKEKNKLEKN